MWKALWPLPLAALLVSFLLYLLVMPSDHKKDLLVFLMAFSMLGIVTGYLTGLSRQPAVSAVLPAVLSLFGGLAVYLIGTDQSKRLAVSLAVLAFATSLVLATSWGAAIRGAGEKYEISEAYLKQRAFIEKEVVDFRRELGLPEERPTERRKAGKEP